MTTALGWVAFVALIAANALFVAAEFATTSVDRGRVARAAAEGDHRAALLQRAVRELSFQLSAAQLGITVCSLLLGFVAEPVVAEALRPAVRGVGLSESAVDPTAIVLALVVATLLQMLFGELVPQNLALATPFVVGRALAPIQLGFARGARPVVALFDNTANAIVRGLGVTPRQELHGARTPVEFRSMIATSVEEGTLRAATARLLDRALVFGTKTAGDVMTPRVRIIALRGDDTVDRLLAESRRTGRSRFPVRGRDLDDILGVAHVGHAFGVPPERRSQTQVRSLLVEPQRVPDSLDCDALLQRLSGASSQLGIVVDEYGGTAGVVTLEDLVEELVGQIRDEHDVGEQAEVEPRPGGGWEVSGQLHKDAMAELMAEAAPRGPFDTVAGYVMSELGRLPEVGDQVRLGEWRLQVMSMAGRRVERVRIEPIAAGAT